MHVIRDLCQGVAGVTVYAGDLNDERLAGLAALAQPLAAKNKRHPPRLQSGEESARRRPSTTSC